MATGDTQPAPRTDPALVLWTGDRVAPPTPNPEGTKSREGWFTPANLLALGQAVATGLLALWSCFVFWTYERSEIDLRNQLQQLELAQSRRRQRTADTPRMRPDHELAIRDLGPNPHDPEQRTYLVDYRYTLENTGETANEVTSVVVHAYTADRLDPAAGEAVRINLPGEPGRVDWRYAVSDGSYVQARYIEDLRFPAPDDPATTFPFRPGSLGTGELDVGEHSQGTVQFVVAARPRDLVALTTTISLNNGSLQGDVWRLDRWETLPVEGESTRRLEDETSPRPAGLADDRAPLFGDPWRTRRE